LYQEVSYHSSENALIKKSSYSSSFKFGKDFLISLISDFKLLKLNVHKSIFLNTHFHSTFFHFSSFVAQSHFNALNILKFVAFSFNSAIAFSGSSHKNIAIIFHKNGISSNISTKLFTHFEIKLSPSKNQYIVSAILSQDSNCVANHCILSLELNKYFLTDSTSIFSSFVVLDTLTFVKSNFSAQASIK
jgi:hypothetical protein